MTARACVRATSTVALWAVLGACASAPSGTPAPSTLSVAQAAEAYLEVAETYNQRLDELVPQLEQAPDLETAQAVMAQILAADEAYLEGVRGIAFPAEAQDEADAVAAAVEAQIDLERRLVDAQTEEEYTAVFEEAAPIFETVRAAIAALREALELPPAPTPGSGDAEG